MVLGLLRAKSTRAVGLQPGLVGAWGQTGRIRGKVRGANREVRGPAGVGGLPCVVVVCVLHL